MLALVACCLWIVPELSLCLVLPKLPDLLLSQSLWNDIWMNTLRSSCINNIRASIWLGGLESISIGSFNHDTLGKVRRHYSSTTRADVNWLLFFLLVYDVQKVFAHSQLFLCNCILGRSALHVINELLKIAIVVHGLAHLNRFGVLPVLLLWILLVDYWQNLIYPRVIRWLNHHHCALFDTSVSLVMIFQENSIMSVWRAILL